MQVYCGMPERRPQDESFHSLKLFCLCREFHCSVLWIDSIQSSLFRCSGRIAGNGKRDAEIVT